MSFLGSDGNFSLLIAGIDEEDDNGEDHQNLPVIEGNGDLEPYIGAALRARNGRQFLTALKKGARVRPGPKAAGAQAVIGRLKRISTAVMAQTGKIEANYMNKPNNLCSVYCPNLAGGATSVFSVQPGTGMSFYRLLSFVATDEQINLFGFSALQVGGISHINFTQSTPAAPVTSAVPWSTLGLKESKGWANLAPWTGQVFDNQTPISGTIVNMTTAAAADLVTVAPRIALLTQVDPCSQRYTQVHAASRSLLKGFRRDMGVWASLGQ